MTTTEPTPFGCVADKKGVKKSRALVFVGDVVNKTNPSQAVMCGPADQPSRLLLLLRPASKPSWCIQNIAEPIATGKFFAKHLRLPFL